MIGLKKDLVQMDNPTHREKIKQYLESLPQTKKDLLINLLLEIKNENSPHEPSKKATKSCSCCEKNTLEKETNDICMNCLWIDDPISWESIDVFSTENRMTLRLARANFKAFGNISGFSS